MWPKIVRLALAIVALIGGCYSILLAGSDPCAPTSSDSPEAIDEIWQKSSSKYDSERAAILEKVASIIRQGPFRADWQSLQQYTVPDWYRDAKFGIFIHWGIYSVPAFGSEWYPRDMYRQGSEEYVHHLATYGPLDEFGYKNFIPMFKAERFDPNAWAVLFKEAGAKYVVPVFEHHDGFAMYDSRLSDWTAAKMGPKRDLVGDLGKAVRTQGLHFGASFHRVEHNFFFDRGRTIRSDVNDPQSAAFYGPAHTWLENKKASGLENDFTYVSPAWAKDWLARSAEIVQSYHPDLIWFDWWIGQPYMRDAVTQFAAFYYNSSLKTSGNPNVINYKYYAMEEHSAVLDVERGQLEGIRALPWQTDTSIGNKSWGYIQDETFKSPEFIIQELTDIVSKNGNLLLNIGPRADGTIPDEVQQTLLQVGSWLKTNGEAIYGTRPWHSFGEGPTNTAAGPFQDTQTHTYTAQDFRFTENNGVLFAIEMGWPSNNETVVHSLAPTKVGAKAQITSVRLLGSPDDLRFEQQSDGLHIRLPAQPVGRYAYVFRIKLANGQ